MKKQPVVIGRSMSADEANSTYGERFGVDWIYAAEPEVTVRVDDLRRALAAVDIAATLDGGLLSGPQERAVMSLRRAIRDGGHFCLYLPVRECPACMSA